MTKQCGKCTFFESDNDSNSKNPKLIAGVCEAPKPICTYYLCRSPVMASNNAKDCKLYNKT